MREEVILVLSNLGAIGPERAVSLEVLRRTESLRGMVMEWEMEELQRLGYVAVVGDRWFLTPVGLLRALSRFS